MSEVVAPQTGGTDEAPQGGRGFGRGGGRGRGGGGRGRGRGGRGRGRGRRKGGYKKFRKAWEPTTKLGRLVEQGKIKTLEEIYRFSIPIKEYQIVDKLFDKEGGGNDRFSKDVPKEGEEKKGLEEQVMKIMPVQKQTRAGQRTRFKAFVIVGDHNGHIGLGVKAAKDVQGAIKGAIVDAKLNLVPVRRGYYMSKLGAPHTIPNKITGTGGSVRIRLIPAPRGTGLVCAKASKKVLEFAGIQDCHSKSMGATRTKGNFLKATYDALSKTYGYLTPDLWGAAQNLEDHPFESMEVSEFKKF